MSVLWTSADAAHATGGDVTVPWEANGISIDTRSIATGDLFIALQGYGVPGTDYAADAVASGAAAVISDVLAINHLDLDVPKAYSAELAKELSSMAGEFYGHPSASMEVIGITGTNGKTSCCYWLSWVLNQLGKSTGQIGTLGAGMPGSQDLTETGFTTPDAIQVQKLLVDCLEAGASAVVMEVSSHGLDQGRAEAVEFDAAIFTNFSQDHLDYHQTMEEYLSAKLKLFSRPELKRAIVNLDDAVAAKVKQAVSADAEVLTYSLNDRTADLYFEWISAQSKGFDVKLAGRWGATEMFLPVLGRYNLSNLLAVICALLARGEFLSDVAAVMASLPSVPGRMQAVQGSANAPQVVVDFAHTPDAVAQSLAALKEQCAGQLTVVLGCGGDRDKTKRPEMAMAAIENSDLQVFTSDNPRSEDPEAILEDMIRGLSASTSCLTIVDRKQAITKAITAASQGDVIAILGKGHEQYQLAAGQKTPFSDIAVVQEALQGVSL